MNSTERVARTIRGQETDRTPIYGWVAANLSGPISAAYGSVAAFEDKYEYDMAHLFAGPGAFDGHLIDRIRAENEELTIEFQPNNGILEAPVYEGDVVGKATLYYGESKVYECDAVALENALSTLEELEAAEGPVSEIEQMDFDPEEEKDLTKEDMNSLWWLILIPAAAILVILVIAIIKNRKKSGLGYITKREKAVQSAELSYQKFRHGEKAPARRSSSHSRGRYRR